MKRRNYIDDPEKREKIEKLLPSGKKKWVRYDEGALLYSMGVHSFEDLAKKASGLGNVRFLCGNLNIHHHSFTIYCFLSKRNAAPQPWQAVAQRLSSLRI